MRITICDINPMTIYVNDKKHTYYGYRASVESPGFNGIWEDSKGHPNISQEEAIGKLLCRLAGLREYNRFTGKKKRKKERRIKMKRSIMVMVIVGSSLVLPSVSFSEDSFY